MRNDWYSVMEKKGADEGLTGLMLMLKRVLVRD